MNTTNSETLHKKAKEILPGGVNSPVRAFKGVGGTPRFISRASGSQVFDVDGNSYVDYVGSWGPMILGHAHPQVIEAVTRVISGGTSFGAPTEVEVDLAMEVIAAVPSIEMVRCVNSGTEATMSALRLARAFTGRDKIIKFEGCYHGHADMLLVQAGSGVTTLGLPDSPGVPKETVGHTLVAGFNDLNSVKRFYDQYPEEIAAVIIEPIAGNMGVVPPKSGFLQELRDLTRSYESLLIFDEVMTGFRVAYGGAQSLYQVQPDLTCLGKIIGGGFPVGAYGGRKEIMQMVAPDGPVYQAGTLSGNPVAMTAGLETLRILRRPGVYDQLEALSVSLAEGLKDSAEAAGIPYFQTRVGSMACFFFTGEQVEDFRTAKTSNTERYARFFHHMLGYGVYLAPSQFEAMFLSLAHSGKDVEKTVAAADNFMRSL